MRSSSRSRFGSLVLTVVIAGLLVMAPRVRVIAQVPQPAAPAVAPVPEKISLGILRRDGIMLPFASYDDGDWSDPWPSQTMNLALPISLDDVPAKWWGAAGPGAQWTAWLAGGSTRSVPLQLQKPLLFPVFCATRLGIRTDYQGPPPTERAPTLPKDGIAIAGGAMLRPIGVMPHDSAESRRMAALILDDFNKAERRAANAFTNWSHPVKAAQREKLPIDLETYYRASEQTKRGEWTVSYVEAVRMFPPAAEDKGCGLITYANGWVIEAGGKKPRVEIAARVTYCDRDRVSFLQPFGRLLLKDEAYWVFQVASWNDEIYGISRVRPNDVRAVVAVAGGSCPRAPRSFGDVR